MLTALLAAYAAVVGLIVGSYLNVVIYRLPRGLSTVLPRSRCTACGAAIRPWDNLPLVSYLLLGGRCRVCRSPISWRYPAIEALTGALFLACFLRFGPRLDTLAAAVFCAAMVVLAAIDGEHMLLPDRITLPGIAVGIAVQVWVPWVGLRGALFGALLGGGILLAFDAAYLLIRRRHGMGLGDVKMLAMVGAFLGWKGVVVTLFASSLAGAVIGLALAYRRRQGLQIALPFGVFLSCGAVLALFFGAPLVDAYLGRLQ